MINTPATHTTPAAAAVCSSGKLNLSYFVERQGLEPACDLTSRLQVRRRNHYANTPLKDRVTNKMGLIIRTAAVRSGAASPGSVMEVHQPIQEALS